MTTAIRWFGLAVGKLLRALRLVAPLALVTGLAMYGQVSYAYVEIAPAGWDPLQRLLLAGGIAVAVESIALYVQWHAHDALLNGHTLTAARQRRASYLIAFGVATVNYSHFAGPGWAPTPAAVCFALFSASGPWLWGLHTRRAQRVQLSREGQLDSTGAVFAAERYRWFPIRTVLALRWSIDRGVSDPRAAWAGFNAEHVSVVRSWRARRNVPRTEPLHVVQDADPRAARDELAKQFLEANPKAGARRLAAHLTENGHPLSPSGAASAYLKTG